MMKRNSKLLTAAVLSSIAALSFASAAFAEEAPMQEFVLDQFVVTASRIPQTITEAKADVSVVSRQEMEEMHMESVEEALRTVPGVQFLNYGANGVNSNLSGIRINGSKDIVILVDGVRVSDFQGSNNGGYIFASLMNNMDNIERIEVVRGSAATIYGSGAKGGVINIITRDINSTKTSFDYSAGSFGKIDLKMNSQGKVDKVGYNVYYGKSQSGNIEDGSGKEWQGETASKNMGAKIAYDFNDQQKLTISYDEMESDFSGIEYFKADKQQDGYSGSYKSKNFTLKHDYQISDMWSNSFTYRTSDVKNNYKFVRNTKDNSNNDFSYKFISDQVTYTTSRHNLIFGLDYSRGEDNIERKVGEINGNIAYGYRGMENYSYYIQDDWEVIPNLTLSGGVRYDKPESIGDGDNADFASHTSRSYKLSYDITDNDTIYAGRSDFYIIPSMEQLANSSYGNPDLQPAEGRTTTIGYSKKFDESNILTLNWFKTESDVSIGYDSDGKYQNYGNGIARGWNAQYMTQIGENWNANVGWAHLFQHTDGDNLSMGYYPKDMLTMGVYYNYAKVSAGLTGYYYMRRVNDKYKGGWPADNYGVFNLSVNYAPTKNLTFYTKVDNIFDKLYAEHTNVIHGGNPGDWYAMPGRSIVVGMQDKF